MSGPGNQESSTKTSGQLKHSAAGQYLGYALQPVRLCFHLLTGSETDEASIENVEDVALHRADGSILLEQTKSALTGNPLSDWSEDFWKTLANWIHTLEQGKATLAQTGFRLYVTPVKKAGKFATAMAAAKTIQDAKIVIKQVETQLSKLASPPACKKYIDQVLSAAPEVKEGLILRFEIVMELDPTMALKNLLKHAVDGATAEAIIKSAIGHAKEDTDALLRNQKTAQLPCGPFQGWLRSFIRTNNIPGYLAALGPSPADDAVAELLASDPVFIQQLSLIEGSDDHKLRAVRDFLRASATKTEWGDRGLVFKENLGAWDDELLRHHAAAKSEADAVHSALSAEKRGSLVYARCLGANPPLDGQAVPGFFVHGSFNALSDRRRLGWHPDYLQLLPPEAA